MGAHSTGKYIKAQCSDTWRGRENGEVSSMVLMTSYEPQERTSRTVCVSPDKTRMKGQAIKWTAGPGMGRARHRAG